MLFKFIKIWRFFFKPRKRRHKRYKSSDYKKAFKWDNKRDFKNKQKGDKYERQIGKEYQNNGYKVYFKGLKEGKSDMASIWSHTRAMKRC